MITLEFSPNTLYETSDTNKQAKTRRLAVKRLYISDSESSSKNAKIFIPVVPKKAFQEFKAKSEMDGQRIVVVGKSKLKQVSSEQILSQKSGTLFSIPNKHGDKKFFEVFEDSKFTKVVGYVPVGESEFIEIVAFNPLLVIIPFILTLTIVFGVCLLLFRPKEPEINRYIEEVDTTETVNTNDSTTRYRLNSTITVAKNTIQNLDFENVNEGKYLRIKIKLNPDDNDYIYDSELVPFGKKIVSDTLSKTDIPAGTYKTIAECYVYSPDKEQIAQTNFEITIIVKE